MNTFIKMIQNQSGKTKVMMLGYIIVTLSISLLNLKLNIFQILRQFNVDIHMLVIILVNVMNSVIIIRLFYLLCINNINSGIKINTIKFVLLFIIFFIGFILTNGIVELLISFVVSTIRNSYFQYLMYFIMFAIRIMVMYVFLLMFLNYMVSHRKISIREIIESPVNMRKQGILLIVYSIVKSSLLYHKVSIIAQNIASLNIFSIATDTKKVTYIITIDQLFEAIIIIILVLYGTDKIRQVNSNN